MSPLNSLGEILPSKLIAGVWNKNFLGGKLLKKSIYRGRSIRRRRVCDDRRIASW